jgi:hypothetical protein
VSAPAAANLLLWLRLTPAAAPWCDRKHELPHRIRILQPGGGASPEVAPATAHAYNPEAADKADPGFVLSTFRLVDGFRYLISNRNTT